VKSGDVHQEKAKWLTPWCDTSTCIFSKILKLDSSVYDYKEKDIIQK
jgi:hypothetical protein